MKKLLIFHSALAPYRIDFFNSFTDKFDCTIVFLSRNNRNQNFNQEDLLSKARFRYEFMDYKFVFNGRDINFGYLYYLIKYKPNIVIGGEFGLPVLLPLFYRIFLNKFKIYTICDDSIDIAKNCNGIRKILRNFLVTKIDGIIVLSNQVEAWYSANFKLINKPIVFPLVRNEKHYRKQLEECLSISKNYIETYNLIDKRVSLYVGRLAKEKNIELLLRSFDNIAQSYDCLVIVGDGDELVRLQKVKDCLINKESIIFVGRYEGASLLAWYNIGHIFILPSYYEPFGAVVYEALAAGCYVLCSVYAGSSTLIDENNGKLFNPDINGDLELKYSEIVLKLGFIKLSSFEYIKPNLISMNFEKYANIMINQLHND